MSSAAAETRENRMGTMPIRKLLVSMSIPMMISMLVQALYNIVDSAFVAQINENAFSGIPDAEFHDCSRHGYGCRRERAALQKPWREKTGAGR